MAALNTNSDDLPMWGMHSSSSLELILLIIFSYNLLFLRPPLTIIRMIGFVGEIHSDKSSDGKDVLFTHMNITIQYNKDQVLHHFLIC